METVDPKAVRAQVLALIKEYREPLSLQRIADEAGLPKSTVAAFLNGGSPNGSINTVNRMIEWYEKVHTRYTKGESKPKKGVRS